MACGRCRPVAAALEPLGLRAEADENVVNGAVSTKSAVPAPHLCDLTLLTLSCGVAGQVALDPLHESGCRPTGAIGFVIPLVSPRALPRQVDRLRATV